ncbi:MAG: PAN domain-containing protein [Acidobacteria bacterium]|nr:PAN domain-containing protein [Acidobacteriota bacterium]
MLSLFLAVLLSATALSAQQLERNTDRTGGDYKDFALTRPDPALCRAACLKEGDCRAWTYGKPGFAGDAAHCWLKNEVPDPTPNTCCVSGVKAETAANMERNTNRPGDDYRDLELENARPQLCQAACEKDRSCRAWTYVKPGIQGDLAHCWLKNRIPEPVEDENCISGVKGAATRGWDRR